MGTTTPTTSSEESEHWPYPSDRGVLPKEVVDENDAKPHLTFNADHIRRLADINLAACTIRPGMSIQEGEHFPYDQNGIDTTKNEFNSMQCQELRGLKR